ncbi:MAG: toll/interleukin-1 receptor domain-containing protein [Actinomycetota bacterium]
MVGSVRAAAGRIFLSHRREESAWADWLADRLAGRYGQGQVVKDAGPVPSGADVAGVITAAVVNCNVLLALIGSQWLTATGGDGRRFLDDPGDVVQLEIEAALAYRVRVIPVLIEGSRMPDAAYLPASLSPLARLQALELRSSHADADLDLLLRAVDQGLADTQATQAGAAVSVPGPPATAPGPPATPPQVRRRRGKAGFAVVGAVAVAAAAVLVFAVLHGGKQKPAASASTSDTSKTLLADDFSTQVNGWAASSPADGSYLSNGTYRLDVTGTGGTAEFAEPTAAAHALGKKTSRSVNLSVDARPEAGVAPGYGYGLACRLDGNGNSYAFVVQDKTVTIEKWVDDGARIAQPKSIKTDAVHTVQFNQLRAACVTTDGGKAVHLQFWVNGTKVADRIDRDHPYTSGYLGVYVETVADASSTAEAEFDNFTVTQP